MRVAFFVALALCIAATYATPIPDELDVFRGRPEVRNGDAPAKDYILIEIFKPVVHYYAAQAHVQVLPAKVASEEAAES